MLHSTRPFSLLCSTLFHFTKESVSQYHCCLSIPFPQLPCISLSVPVSLFPSISLSVPGTTVPLYQSCSVTDSSVLDCIFQSLSTSVTPPQYQSFSTLPCSTLQYLAWQYQYQQHQWCCTVSCLQRPSSSSGGSVTIFIVILASHATSLFHPTFLLSEYRAFLTLIPGTFYWSSLLPLNCLLLRLLIWEKLPLIVSNVNWPLLPCLVWDHAFKFQWHQLQIKTCQFGAFFLGFAKYIDIRCLQRQFNSSIVQKVLKIVWNQKLHKSWLFQKLSLYPQFMGPYTYWISV